MLGNFRANIRRGRRAAVAALLLQTFFFATLARQSPPQKPPPPEWTPPAPRANARTPFAPHPFRGDNIFEGEAERWLADAV